MTFHSSDIQKLIRLGIGVSVASSLLILVRASDALSRWLAFTATTGSTAALVLSLRPRTSSPSASQLPPQPTVLAQRPPSLYQGKWTLKDQAADEGAVGQAAVVDFGSDIVVSQPSAGGLYVMQLKRQTQQQVSGIWWFYKQMPAHGTYRGEISADGSTISGAWRMTRSAEEGLWILTAEPTDSES